MEEETTNERIANALERIADSLGSLAGDLEAIRFAMLDDDEAHVELKVKVMGAVMTVDGDR